MKGLCIILIVQQHIDGEFYNQLAPNLNNALQSFRVPMYYFLSGLFFKLYEGFFDFSRRKTNNMLIPLVFFEVLALLIGGCIYAYKTSKGVVSTVGFEWTYIFEPIIARDWHYTFPLWFLLSLFEVNVIFYLLQRYLPTLWQLVIVAALALTGFAMSRYQVYLPLQLDTAFIGLPYFILGYHVKKAGLLKPSKYDKWGRFALIPMLVLIYFASGKIDIHFQKLPNLLQLYLIPAVAILTLFFACKGLPRIPGICYFGQYSLIILGTHGLFAAQFRIIGQALLGTTGPMASFVALLLALLLEAGIIAFMIKVFPRFTAQKDFFTPGWKPFWLKSNAESK